jgi:hypothetical protein
MPFCSNCGSPVSEYDRFCNKCGQALVPPPPNQQGTLISYYPAKPSTNLSNGIFIGAGIVMLFIGLSIAFSINGIYNQQVSYLAVEGIQVNSFAVFGDLVLWISWGILFAVLGVYILVLGALNQFSSKVRTAMNLKDSMARLGNGLITGGFVFTALSLNGAVTQFYRSTFNARSADISMNVILITVGLVLIILGALLITSAYQKSQHTFTR